MTKSAVWLIISASLIFAMGLLMVFNTTAAEIIDRSLDTNTHTALFKQIAYALVGLTGGLIAYRFGYQRLISNSAPLLILGTIGLILVFIPGIGFNINGARRWVGLLGYPIGQP